MPLTAPDISNLRLTDPPASDPTGDEPTPSQIIAELEAGFSAPPSSSSAPPKPAEEGLVSSAPDDDLIPPSSPYSADPGVRDAAVAVMHLIVAVGTKTGIDALDAEMRSVWQEMLDELWEHPSSGPGAEEGRGGEGVGEGRTSRVGEDGEVVPGEEETRQVNEDVYRFVEGQRIAAMKEALEGTRVKLTDVARLETQVCIKKLLVDLGDAGAIPVDAPAPADPKHVETLRDALGQELRERRAAAGAAAEAVAWVDVNGRVRGFGRAGLEPLRRPGTAGS